MTWRWFIGMKIKTARRRLARWIAPPPETTGTIIMNNTIHNDPARGIFIGSKGDK